MANDFRYYVHWIKQEIYRRVKEYKQQNPLKFWISGSLLTLAVIGIVFCIGFYLAVILGMYGEVPGKDDLRNIENQEASSVYSADSVLIGKYYVKNRTQVPFKRLPDHLTEALVATEDARFYEHDGVDEQSLLRVLIKTVLLGQDAGGGSTISQQLIKNLYPRKASGLLSLPAHKLREMIGASRLEEVYTKKDILALYLNTVPFGENTYGVSSAAYRYFNKKPHELTVEEAAVIVGMLKATTYYNPKLHPERAKSRRNVVLHQMEKNDKLTKAQYDSLKALPLKLDYKRVGSDSEARYLTRHIESKLNSRLKEYNNKHDTDYDLYRDGLNVYTSIHSGLQKYAVQAVKEHLAVLQEDFDRHWKGRGLWKKNRELLNKEIRNLDQYKKLKAKGVAHKAILDSLSQPHKMTVYTEQGQEVRTMSTLDSLKHHLRLLHGSFLAMEPESGRIKAWVGDRDYSFFQYDYVKSSRPVGSTFKPFVYATALKQGIDPCKFFKNERKKYDSLDGWHPRNASGEYKGYFSMKGALTHSVNVVSVQMIMKTGVKDVIKLARDFGIKEEIPEVPSIALGTAELSLYDMVPAYGVFASGGKRAAPRVIMRVEDAKGRKLFGKQLKKQKSERVYPEAHNQMMLEMLKSVVDSGTASRIRSKYGFKGPVGGKTGTTQKQSDGWFIGVKPRLVAGSWVGGSHPQIRFRNLRLGQGANTALPVWAKFMKKVKADEELQYYAKGEFPEPSDSVMDALDCPLYKDEKDERNFWEKLFGVKKDKDAEEKQEEKEKEEDKDNKDKKGLLDKIKGVFKKDD